MRDGLIVTSPNGVYSVDRATLRERAADEGWTEPVKRDKTASLLLHVDVECRVFCGIEVTQTPV